jgi:hypothetical protein
VGVGVGASAAQLRVSSLYWSLTDVYIVQSSSGAHRGSVLGDGAKERDMGMGGNM